MTWVCCTEMIKDESGSGNYVAKPAGCINMAQYSRFEPYTTSGGEQFTLVHSEGDDFYFKEPIAHFEQAVSALSLPA